MNNSYFSECAILCQRKGVSACVLQFASNQDAEAGGLSQFPCAVRSASATSIPGYICRGSKCCFASFIAKWPANRIYQYKLLYHINSYTPLQYETEITYIGKYGDVKLTGTGKNYAESKISWCSSARDPISCIHIDRLYLIGRRAYNQAENKGVHMATVRSEGENPTFEYHYFLALFDIGLEFHYNKYVKL